MPTADSTDDVHKCALPPEERWLRGEPCKHQESASTQWHDECSQVEEVGITTKTVPCPRNQEFLWKSTRSRMGRRRIVCTSTCSSMCVPDRRMPIFLNASVPSQLGVCPSSTGIVAVPAEAAAIRSWIRILKAFPEAALRP